MLEPSSFSMVSDSIADGNGTKSGARGRRVETRLSLYAVIAYIVCVSLLLLLLLFLRLRVHVYSRVYRLCMRLCASLTRVCDGIPR